MQNDEYKVWLRIGSLSVTDFIGTRVVLRNKVLYTLVNLPMRVFLVDEGAPNDRVFEFAPNRGFWIGENRLETFLAAVPDSDGTVDTTRAAQETLGAPRLAMIVGNDDLHPRVVSDVPISGFFVDGETIESIPDILIGPNHVTELLGDCLVGHYQDDTFLGTGEGQRRLPPDTAV